MKFTLYETINNELFIVLHKQFHRLNLNLI
jgi:hypothetical protein